MLNLSDASPLALAQARAVLEAAVEHWRSDEGDLPDEEMALRLASDPRSCTEFELLAAIVRAAVHSEILAEGCKERRTEILHRQERFTARAERLRAVVTEAMLAMKENRLVLPDLSVHVRNGRAGAEITDPAQIPARFKVPQPDKIDTASVKEAVLAGEDIPGTVRRNPQPGISISRR